MATPVAHGLTWQQMLDAENENYLLQRDEYYARELVREVIARRQHAENYAARKAVEHDAVLRAMR